MTAFHLAHAIQSVRDRVRNRKAKEDRSSLKACLSALQQEYAKVVANEVQLQAFSHFR